jgi:hypothetical protein
MRGENEPRTLYKIGGIVLGDGPNKKGSEAAVRFGVTRWGVERRRLIWKLKSTLKNSSMARKPTQMTTITIERHCGSSPWDKAPIPRFLLGLHLGFPRT